MISKAARNRRQEMSMKRSSCRISILIGMVMIIGGILTLATSNTGGSIAGGVIALVGAGVIGEAIQDLRKYAASDKLLQERRERTRRIFKEVSP